MGEKWEKWLEFKRIENKYYVDSLEEKEEEGLIIKLTSENYKKLVLCWDCVCQLKSAALGPPKVQHLSTRSNAAYMVPNAVGKGTLCCIRRCPSDNLKYRMLHFSGVLF